MEADLGNSAEARRLHRRAIEIDEKHFDPHHLSLAIRLWNLAVVEADEGNIPAAVEMARKAHRIWLGKIGPDHPHAKRARDWLARKDPGFDPTA